MVSNEKYVLYGVGRRCRRLIREYQGCENSIAFAVDKNGKNTLEDGLAFKVYAPEVFSSSEYQSQKIVITISDPQSIDIIRKQLLSYGLSDSKIISAEEWIADCLEYGIARLSPETVHLDICTFCQLNCRDCYMRIPSGQTIGQGLVSVSQFSAFLDENRKIRNVEISNSGEPFIHPHLHEILTEAKKRQVSITISNGTNFNYVTDEVLSDLTDGTVKHLNISIDGASQEVYSIYRRKGDFEQVIANIKKLNALKKMKNTVLPKLTWQFVLMQHNLCDIDRAKSLAEELGMTIVFKESWNTVESSAVKKLIRTKSYSESNSAALPIGVDSAHYTNNDLSYCSMLHRFPQINWDGRLLGCCIAYDTDWGLNVFQQGLFECINSKDYLNTVIRLLRKETCPDETPCHKCWYSGNFINGSYV